MSLTEQSLVVKIRTLTPLYTGGVDGTMDRIHETGILGSLRWWYEAIVRGLGGSACDPTGESRCPDKEGKYCDVCAVFGATGLQRAFRLEGPVWRNEHRDHRLNVKVHNNRGWFLGRGFMGQGELRVRTLHLPERWTELDLQQAMLLTLRLLACWGGLGTKTQQGYGVVDVSCKPSLDVDSAVDAIQALQQRQRRRANENPGNRLSLGNFVFAKIRFSLDNPKSWLKTQTTRLTSDEEIEWHLKKDETKPPVIPLAPVVRYYLRQLIRDHMQYNGHPNAPARWQLMGVVNGLWHTKDFGKIVEEWYCPKCHNDWDHRPSKQEHGDCTGKPRKKAQCTNCGQVWSSFQSARSDSSTEAVERKSSLIHVSHAYSAGNNQWEFRIWGPVPEKLPGGVLRTTVLQHLRQWLGVTEERQWHTAQTSNDTLWGQNRLNLKEVQVCWFSKAKGEKADAYLQALLQGCDWGHTEKQKREDSE